MLSDYLQKISENKDKLKKLTTELAAKSQALQKHWSQNMSPDMDEEYRKLAEQDFYLYYYNENYLNLLFSVLTQVSVKVSSKQKDKSKLAKAHTLVEPDNVSHEIDQYFKEIKSAYENCKVIDISSRICWK